MPHSVVTQKIENALDGSYLFLIPRSFSYFYPHDKIIEEVLKVPRIHNVNLIRKSRNEIYLDFEEYVPHALWCNELNQATSTKAHCLFMNEEGLAFAEAPPLSGGSLLRHVNEEHPPAIGEYVFDRETLLLQQEFIDALAERHTLRVSSIIVTHDGDLIYSISDGGDILVSKEMSIQDVFVNLESILSSDEFGGLSSGISNISIYDLEIRFM